MSLDNLDKIIIKIGSSLIINEENAINDLFLDEISKDILSLEKRGIKTLIVSSGAIELGKIDLNKSKNKLNLSESQAASSIGPIKLINAWKIAVKKVKKPNKKKAKHRTTNKKIIGILGRIISLKTDPIL